MKLEHRTVVPNMECGFMLERPGFESQLIGSETEGRGFKCLRLSPVSEGYRWLNDLVYLKTSHQ